MLPNLREPLRLMDLIAVLGQPNIPIWRNDHLVTTTDEDTVSLLTATGAPGGAIHSGYSIERDCVFAADGSELRFGADVVLEGRYPNYRVRRVHPTAPFDVRLTATRTVT